MSDTRTLGGLRARTQPQLPAVDSRSGAGIVSASERTEGHPGMYARLVEIQVAPDKMDECITIFRDRNAPSIAEHRGFDHGHWFVDRTTGEAISVTFWMTEADERASRANIPRLIEGMAHVLASYEVRQETFETVHEQRRENGDDH